ncbi:sensor histidine kinase [Leucothrix pacifica]|uniref:C4-dicarboxylate transport sensor protein DctB n=1 Tax=Leucothrix pacifica TaxID=1247513 RepID=A0A317C342_9GAMM|nr:ATP-binding protein [Leucothrix pacifica]PWQ92707.1 sensor histidine kinase [Leucothrix pacifica]
MNRLTQLKPHQVTKALIIFGLMISALVLWQTAYWTKQVASDEIRNRSSNTLKLVVSNLNAELQRFRALPELISADKRLIPVLNNTADAQQLRALNLELARINRVSGASDVYLMKPDGWTVAASNWDKNPTFIDRNFSFRPYFKIALQGELGTYFALGTTSGERGYFFAYPVVQANKVQGVVVVKITVEGLENKWRQAKDKIMVLDSHGIVFLASNTDWHLKLVNDLTDKEMAGIVDSRRYGDHKFEKLPIESASWDDEVLRELQLADDAGQMQRYFVEQENMPAEGWRVMLLVGADEITGRVNAALAVAALMLASLLLAIANIVQRRRRLAERMAMKDATSRELERRVEERTLALSETNEKLRNEVREREHAESELRDTQAGLVQATKLAALGQMSAGVSHELNQPLAAIRSYADNAKTFIERGNTATASENLQSIGELADRMDRIIKNLRTYARDESISMRPVSIILPLNESLSLLANRISDDGVEVNLSIPDESPVVMAGDVRLQQVFVNILSNALDSMRSVSVKMLDISVTEQADKVYVSIADSGSGVPEALREHVFDPFYSTKSVGEGMGLGLSITYGIVDQFGGKIEIDNRPQGGAIFTVILKKADLSATQALSAGTR